MGLLQAARPVPQIAAPVNPGPLSTDNLYWLVPVVLFFVFLIWYAVRKNGNGGGK